MWVQICLENSIKLNKSAFIFLCSLNPQLIYIFWAAIKNHGLLWPLWFHGISWSEIFLLQIQSDFYHILVLDSPVVYNFDQLFQVDTFGRPSWRIQSDYCPGKRIKYIHQWYRDYESFTIFIFPFMVKLFLFIGKIVNQSFIGRF